MSVTSSETLPESRDRESIELLERACAETDPAQASRLRERVVLLNRGLAIGLARRFEGRGIEFEDLSQVAMLGLVQAARRYAASTPHQPDRRAPPMVALACHQHLSISPSVVIKN